MTRVIVDTDPGIDDALALLLASASPEIRIEAVTVVAGNVGLDPAARNALLTLETAGLAPLPTVARGAAGPLERGAVDASHVHGDDGLGGAAEEYGPPAGVAASGAVELMLQTISRDPGEITVVALGPLTNLARAFLADAGTMAVVRNLVIMGGALRAPGNVTPTAEFNFYADPDAARIVLGAGVPTTVVALDATTKATVSRDELVRRASASAAPGAKFAERVTRGYFEFREARTGRAECLLHDPLAVAVAFDPSLVSTERHVLDVETDGRLTTGMLVADLRETAEPPGADRAVEVAVDVDSDRFRGLFLDRLFG